MIVRCAVLREKDPVMLMGVTHSITCTECINVTIMIKKGYTLEIHHAVRIQEVKNN